MLGVRGALSFAGVFNLSKSESSLDDFRFGANVFRDLYAVDGRRVLRSLLGEPAEYVAARRRVGVRLNG